MTLSDQLIKELNDAMTLAKQTEKRLRVYEDLVERACDLIVGYMNKTTSNSDAGVFLADADHYKK